MSAADRVFDLVDAVLPERAKALLFIGFVLIVAKIAPHAYQHAWAWYAGLAIQLVLAACGVLHLALLALGVLFGGVWAYVLSVRRSVLGSA